VAPYRIVIVYFLAAISAFSQPAGAQEKQDLFQSELTEASQEKDSSKVLELISEHRLWVKPVVNQLISDYIHQTMAVRKARALSLKDAATLISQCFEETYGEKSLSIATAYLNSWTMEQLGKKAQADRIYGIATDHRLNGQADEALKEYQRALALYRDIGDVRGEGEVLGGMGYVYYVNGSDTCLSYYQMALEARMKADDRYLIGGTLNTIGLIHYNFFYDLDKSIEYFNKAAVVREEIGHLAGLGSTLSIMGEVYKFNGEVEHAIASFERSYLIHQKVGNPFRMAEAKLNSGSILINTGKYPEALENLHISLEMAQEMSDTLMLGDVYAQLGKAHTYLGDYETAIQYATTAFSMYEAIDDSWGLAGAYNNTGLVLDEVGRISKALEYYEKSLEIYTELGDQEHLIILSNNLGIIEFNLGKFKDAEEYHLQALQISKDIELESGKLTSLVNLANAQNRLGKLDEALAHYESALRISRQLNSPDTEWRVMVGIAENHKLRGDYSMAIEYNESGLRIIEGLRTTLQNEEYRSSYLARERYAFEDVIHMLGELHEADQSKAYDLLAFEYAQRCKSRSFLDQMENSNQASTGKDDHYSARTVSLKDVQKSDIEENAVILEYSLGDSCSYLWVITRDKHKMIKLPDRKTLRDLVETFRFSILNPEQDNKTFLRESGYKLYKELIEPAEPFISRKSNLVILSDGVLHYVPFQVLITDPPEKHPDQSYKELSYLVKQYPISYGQSASVLMNLIKERNQVTEQQQIPKNLIAFGDPDYTAKGSEGNLIPYEFHRLEYSGNEVEGIASFFEDGMADIYLREHASEENVKLNNSISEYRYIHFACHGVVDENNPENSSLVLSQDSSSAEDGFFQASEISVLKLNADLVVLSACQTGLGKLIRGEGMIGLSRSFMYAGTPSLVVSLWSVSDVSTSILMKNLYENLIRKRLSKAEALHLAQISMIKDENYAHPFFWAPFVLTGNWR
jgi:CHAT domain-containing protein/Tfp pilus assembly protein PilF